VCMVETSETTYPMRLDAPFAHRIQYCLVRPDDVFDPIVYGVEFAIGDDNGDLDDSLLFMVQT
jgi:hypothetical protein